ncbi:MAG: sodium/solute symporter [Luteitalea sp.]|nr:sodium/solute symporter [Luteitalea sp.]
MKALQTLDFVVIVIYLAAIAAIGLWYARSQRTTDDYFLAGRSIPGWAVGFSLVGTIISSVSFVALPGTAFSGGWWLLIPNLMALPVLLLVMAYLVPFYRRVVRMSSYEYLERRFGVGARLYGAASFLVLRIVDLGFTLLLTAIAVEVMTGWDIYLVLAGVGIFTLIYTVIGGVQAVIWTDVVQGIILFAGALILLAILMFTPPGGPGAVLSAAYEGGRFSLGDFGLVSSGDRATFWLLALAGLIHFGRSYATEQNMVQRYLVARTDGDARRGIMVGVIGSVLIWTIFFLIGSCLWAFFQLTAAGLPAHVARRPDDIVPYFIVHWVPQGIVGLLLAAILAAANSTVSADLNSVATVATQDFFARARPSSDDRVRLWFGRAAVLVAGLASITTAAFLAARRGQAVYEIFITLSMILAGGMLGLFALGFFSRDATRRGAYAAIVVCMMFVLWATITGPLDVDIGMNFKMHPMTIGIFGNLIMFVTGWTASRFLGGPRADLAGLTLGRTARADTAKAG